MGGIATATEREAKLEAELAKQRARPAPTADELRGLGKRLRAIAKAIFQSGKLDIPFAKDEFATIFSPLVAGWYSRANALNDKEQKRLFEAVASLVKLRSGVAVDSPIERLTSIADDCDALATTLEPQLVTVEDDGVAKPDVVLGDHPQITITIEGTPTPIPLEHDHAVYLKSLIEQSEMDDPWLSDAEFKESHQEFGENVRPDRWRKALHPTIKVRIKTTSRGTLWVGKPSP